jgi:hypothetical protein
MNEGLFLGRIIGAPKELSAQISLKSQEPQTK